MKTKIKNILKKSKLISAINAKVKCKQLKSKYKKIVEKYESVKQKYTFEELMLQKGFTKEWKESLKNKKLNIYFFGKDEFQDKSGFIQDLGQVSNLTYFIKKDGTYGRYSEDQIYNGISGKILNTNSLIASVENLITNYKKPDLIIFQALGKTFEIDKLKEFKVKNNLNRYFENNNFQRFCEMMKYFLTYFNQSLYVSLQ